MVQSSPNTPWETANEADMASEKALMVERGLALVEERLSNPLFLAVDRGLLAAVNAASNLSAHCYTRGETRQSPYEG